MNIQFDKTKMLARWKEVLIVLLIAVSIFTYWRNDQNKKKLAEEIARRNFILTEGTINSGTADVDKREAELYPKIDAKINELNKNVKVLDESIKRLQKNKPTKEQSYELFKNQSTSQLSKYFSGRGYTNSITPSPSPK